MNLDLKKIISLVMNGEENRVYKLQVWRRKRDAILKRDNYECQHCKKKRLRKIVRATHVHHIQELKHRPDLALDDDNLDAILKRDNYECQHCKKKRLRKIVRATHVHHIQELKHRPDLALDDDNLISLCFDCHEEMHDRNANNRKQPKFVNEERW